MDSSLFQPTTETDAIQAVNVYYGETTATPDEDILSNLTQKQQTRAKNAIHERLSVIPQAPGMYWVITYSDEQYPRKYSINYDVQSCTCKDYMYNCDPDIGPVCKHIWMVRLLIQERNFPDQQTVPINWLQNQTQSDISLYQNQKQHKLAMQAETLLNFIKRSETRKVNLPWAFRKRAELLADYLDYDTSKYTHTPKTILEDGNEALF